LVLLLDLLLLVHLLDLLEMLLLDLLKLVLLVHLLQKKLLLVRGHHSIHVQVRWSRACSYARKSRWSRLAASVGILVIVLDTSSILVLVLASFILNAFILFFLLALVLALLACTTVAVSTKEAAVRCDLPKERCLLSLRLMMRHVLGHQSVHGGRHLRAVYKLR